MQVLWNEPPINTLTWHPVPYRPILPAGVKPPHTGKVRTQPALHTVTRVLNPLNTWTLNGKTDPPRIQTQTAYVFSPAYPIPHSKQQIFVRASDNVIDLSQQNGTHYNLSNKFI